QRSLYAALSNLLTIAPTLVTSRHQQHTPRGHECTAGAPVALPSFGLCAAVRRCRATPSSASCMCHEDYSAPRTAGEQDYSLAARNDTATATISYRQWRSRPLHANDRPRCRRQDEAALVTIGFHCRECGRRYGLMVTRIG